MVAPVIEDPLKDFPQPLVLNRAGNFFVSDLFVSQVTVTTAFAAIVEVRLILPANLSLTFMNDTKRLVAPPKTFTAADTLDVDVEWRVRRRVNDSAPAQVPLRVEASYQGNPQADVRLHQMAVVEQTTSNVAILAGLGAAAAVTAGVVGAIRAGRKRSAKKRAASRSTTAPVSPSPREKSPASKTAARKSAKKAASKPTKKSPLKAASERPASTSTKSSKGSSKKTTKRSTNPRR